MRRFLAKLIYPEAFEDRDYSKLMDSIDDLCCLVFKTIKFKNYPEAKPLHDALWTRVCNYKGYSED